MTQLLKKDPEADLALKYRKVLEISTIFALLIMIATFYAFKKFEVGTTLPESVDIKIEMIEIPPTEQIQRPPPPARPSIPIEAEDDEMLDDVTIEETEVVFEARDDTPPPPPDEDDGIPPCCGAGTCGPGVVGWAPLTMLGTCFLKTHRWAGVSRLRA